MTSIEEGKIATYKDISKVFGIAETKAKKMAKITRDHYEKGRGGDITISQVRRANRLET